MLQAIYRSTMDEDIGKGLQTKSQKELIGKDGVYRKTGINKFSVPTHTKSKGEIFVDVLTGPLLRYLEVKKNMKSWTI